MLRDVVIRQTMHEMLGDENVEVWLKIGGGDWTLDRTVDVEAGPTQDFEFLGLEADTLHVMQTRAVRAGRYRAGYLGGDPDAWPAQSRVEFVPGVAPAAAPTIADGVWDDSTVTAEITVTPNPAHLDLDLQLLQDGVVVATIAAPHVGDVVFEDVLGASDGNTHAYTSRHIVGGGLNGALSDIFLLYQGPLSLNVDLVEYDSAVGEENMKVYFTVLGDQPPYDTLKLFWRWAFGSVDYPGGGGAEHEAATVGPGDSPAEFPGTEFGYSLPAGAGSTEHHMEFILRAYLGGVFVQESLWTDGFFVTPP